MRKLAPHFVKIFLPLHFLAAAAFILFVQNFTLVHLTYVLAGWMLIGGYGIAVGHHRLLSHQSFRTYKSVEHLLALLGVFAGQGSGLFWVAVHRGSHHPYADTEKDLHSPIHGDFYAYLGWQMYLNPAKVTFKQCRDLLQDPWHVFIHKHYIRIFWGGILALTMIDWRLGLFGVVIPSFISMHTENCVDLFCHKRAMGYRNYDTRDNSTNIWWLGYLGFGQGWHNNHHADPAAYYYSKKWWELDLTRLMIAPIKKYDLSTLSQDFFANRRPTSRY